MSVLFDGVRPIFTAADCISPSHQAKTRVGRDRDVKASAIQDIDWTDAFSGIGHTAHELRNV